LQIFTHARTFSLPRISHFTDSLYTRAASSCPIYWAAVHRLEQRDHRCAQDVASSSRHQLVAEIGVVVGIGVVPIGAAPGWPMVPIGFALLSGS